MKRKIFVLLLCLIVSLGVPFAMYGCKESAGDEKTGGSVLLADFEDVSSSLQNMIFYYNFGRLQITDEAKFVTNGQGAAKINAMGDDYIAGGNPAFEIVVPESEKDFSNLNKITFDAYNDTDREEYTVGMYLRLLNAKGVKTESKKVVLKKGESVTVAPSFDVSLMNIGYDLKSVYSVGFEFDKVGQKYEGKNDIYIDNVRLTKYETTPEAIETTLKENELCSFDHLWQKSVCYPTAYAAMPGFEISVSINTDMKFVKSGKSLKIEIPASWPELNWDWPYLKFSEKYVEKMNLSQYDDDDTICLWVYSDNDFSVPIDLHFWRKSATEDRGTGSLRCSKGWNLLTWKFGKINEKDMGVGKITDDLSDIRFVFSNVGKPVTLYFDEFFVVKGN